MEQDTNTAKVATNPLTKPIQPQHKKMLIIVIVLLVLFLSTLAALLYVIFSKPKTDNNSNSSNTGVTSIIATTAQQTTMPVVSTTAVVTSTATATTTPTSPDAAYGLPIKDFFNKTKDVATWSLPVATTFNWESNCTGSTLPVTTTVKGFQIESTLLVSNPNYQAAYDKIMKYFDTAPWKFDVCNGADSISVQYRGYGNTSTGLRVALTVRFKYEKPFEGGPEADNKRVSETFTVQYEQ